MADDTLREVLEAAGEHAASDKVLAEALPHDLARIAYRGFILAEFARRNLRVVGTCGSCKRHDKDKPLTLSPCDIAEAMGDLGLVNSDEEWGCTRWEARDE